MVIRLPARSLVGLALVLLFFSVSLAEAQQHRATHLGNPATRFAPPLSRPEDLRALFRNERLRPDIAEILRQAGWRGRLEDLYQAAASERITEVKLPKGTRLPFMSSRTRGRPVALRDVLWEGRNPIDAYVFVFNSNGRRYRCVTPKACSNFLLVDLGPLLPILELELRAPRETSVCDPVEVRLLVRNAGHMPLTQVRVNPSLPEGLVSEAPPPPGAFDLGTLRPGEVRDLHARWKPTARGEQLVTVTATSAEGGESAARATVSVRGPILELACQAPAEVPIGRPARVCLELRNTGDAPEEQATLRLPIPPGVRVESIEGGGTHTGGEVVWSLGSLAPQASARACANLIQSVPGTHALAPRAAGLCAPPAQADCAIRILGVPGILLEVVDVEDPIEVGLEAIYDIRVTNQGLADLTQVRLTAALPEIQAFVSATGATPVRAEGAALTFEPLATLDAKATATWRVVVRAQQAGIARFQVELECEPLPGRVLEIETTNHY